MALARMSSLVAVARTNQDQAWWCMPAILELQEWRQEDHKSKVIVLCYIEVGEQSRIH